MPAQTNTQIVTSFSFRNLLQPCKPGAGFNETHSLGCTLCASHWTWAGSRLFMDDLASTRGRCKTDRITRRLQGCLSVCNCIRVCSHWKQDTCPGKTHVVGRCKFSRSIKCAGP